MPTTQKMRTTEDKTIIQDFTPALALEKRTFTLLEDLGLWDEANTEYLYTDSLEVEREIENISEMFANARGGERNYMVPQDAETAFFKVPFFTLDGRVDPKDRFKLRKFGTVEQSVEVENLVAKKVSGVQRSHANLHRMAQYVALVDNKVHAIGKDGKEIKSIAKDFSSVWGTNRLTHTMDLQSDKDPLAELETVRQQIIKNAGDNGDDYRLVVLLSSADFQAIVHHPTVEAAYSAYSSAEEPLRNRLSGNKNNQMFTHQGVTLISDISGKIKAGKAHLMPLDFDGMFTRLYSPADTLDQDGEIAKEAYMWTEESRRVYRLESEVAVAYIIKRPELICDITVSK
tara:strand:+ start:1862 stop:2893 length:1032 start_codon:yes stop_codon:yes gene_type:complete